MATQRKKRAAASQLLFAGLIAAVISVCVWASTSVWDEAYGAGPPYFNRTTNMDKWQDPSAQLLRLNGIGLLIVTALAMAILRLRRHRHRP
jgi:hypothetical protein